jgi:hypothetical protein
MSTRPQQECRTGFVWKHTARIRLISAIRHHEVRANCSREMVTSLEAAYAVCWNRITVLHRGRAAP